MSKQRAIFLLGLWVAVLPFLGFPNAWRKPLFVLSGLLLIYISYTLRKKITMPPRRPEPKPFKDNLNDF